MVKYQSLDTEDGRGEDGSVIGEEGRSSSLNLPPQLSWQVGSPNTGIIDHYAAISFSIRSLCFDSEPNYRL